MKNTLEAVVSSISKLEDLDPEVRDEFLAVLRRAITHKAKRLGITLPDKLPDPVAEPLYEKFYRYTLTVTVETNEAPPL